MDNNIFHSHVRNNITPLLRQACGNILDGLVINQVEEMNFRIGLPTNIAGHVWSSILEIYFVGKADMLATLSDSIFPVLREFDDIIVERTVVPVTEIMMYNNLSSCNPLKVFGFFHITGSMTRLQVHEYWYGPHAEMGLQLKANDFIRKYSQNHTLLDYIGPDLAYQYDGASIAYFDDVEDAEKIYRNPAIMEVSEADELLMGTEPAAVVSVSTREDVVFDNHGRHATSDVSI